MVDLVNTRLRRPSITTKRQRWLDRLGDNGVVGKQRASGMNYDQQVGGRLSRQLKKHHGRNRRPSTARGDVGEDASPVDHDEF